MNIDLTSLLYLNLNIIYISVLPIFLHLKNIINFFGIVSIYLSLIMILCIMSNNDLIRKNE